MKSAPNVVSATPISVRVESSSPRQPPLSSSSVLCGTHFDHPLATSPGTRRNAEADAKPIEQQEGSKEETAKPEAKHGPGNDATAVVNGAVSISDKGNETASSIGRPSTPDTLASQIDIHPFFLAPRSARPDRDLGIPESEAEDVRRLLQLYIQKQEEVCRGAKRLYHGLLRAERMRKTVLQWAKYEAHVGPNGDMSDGEDWYDKEEWGLDEDLKKGQDEEEEDTSQPAKKRTRTHR